MCLSAGHDPTHPSSHTVGLSAYKFQRDHHPLKGETTTPRFTPLNSTMSQEIVLFDLPSQDPCRSWSLNPWKTRLLLNYKGIPYKTTWLEYPDIAPRFQSLGVPAHKPGASYADHTVPAVKLPDGRYVMESEAIAQELDKLFPEPSLPLDLDLVREVQGFVGDTVYKAARLTLPRVARDIIRAGSSEYFNRTKGERLGGVGTSLDQIEKELNLDEAWKTVEPGLRKIGDLLRANDQGPFLLGQTVSYADFVIVGLLHFFRRVGEDVYQRAVAVEPLLAELYEASKPWLVRDDH